MKLTDISGTPVDVVVVKVEGVLEGRGRKDHVAGGGVKNSLGLAG